MEKYLFAVAACALALAAPRADAQAYKPTPVDQCFTLASLRIGSDRGSPASPLPHELTPRLDEALAACEQAVKERPTEGRLHARLARMRALAGDAKGALEAARKGAELRSETALTMLGVMHAEGRHLPRDYAAAQDYLRRAAKAGEPHAHFNLGAMSANGWGVEQDDADAAASFRQAAQGGDALAMQLLGQRYDKSQAEQWFRGAAEAMLTEVPRNPLRIAGVEINSAALVASYREKGEPWAQAYLGLLHEAGLAGESRWARFKLGAIYLETMKDYSKAEAWLRRSAADGHPGALNNLGWMHEKGLGMKVDYAAARDHYLAALGGGNPQAKGNLESFFAAGRGAPSGAAAVDWYRPGAEAGISSAQYRLGMMYARGEGVPQNDRVAAQWLSKAAQQGHAEARKEAAELFYKMGASSPRHPHGLKASPPTPERTSRAPWSCASPASRSPRPPPSTPAWRTSTKSSAGFPRPTARRSRNSRGSEPRFWLATRI